MSECCYKSADGHCTKWRSNGKCEPSTVNWCDEPVDMIEVDRMCENSSIFGNTYNFITEEQLNELRAGKAIWVGDGEYCHFIILKPEDV